MTEYNKVFITQRADPFVTKGKNGEYYFTASVPEYDGIRLRCADSIEGLKNAKEKEVWHKHPEGKMSIHVWAPELHYLFGGWYIYFAAGDKDDIWNIRPYVLKCEGEDPMNDKWVECGPMLPADDDEFSFTQFSLDGTTFEHKGKNYFVWAEKVGSGKQISNLYIAEMESPNKLKTIQELITSPDYAWERIGFWVNEGPAVLKNKGRIYLTYSASDTGPAYCMGLLSADENSDLLDPQNWKKETRPVLASDESLSIYGPGHNSFTTDDDGNIIMVYHARTEKEIVGDPLYNPNRHTMLMKVDFKEDGEPVFKY
ncbi:MAG: family 43 glycosylhydrolase [Lachnospiraceae bacterium]|nr:family 43 glycosylhydrolase [Lachnospiraceae bacterium]